VITLIETEADFKATVSKPASHVGASPREDSADHTNRVDSPGTVDLTASSNKATSAYDGQLSQRLLGSMQVVFADVPSICQHTVGLVLSVISIWSVHITFNALLGADATFYGSFPVSWCFDTAHITVIVRYTLKLARPPATSSMPTNAG
jgi:hypothetical protein